MADTFSKFYDTLESPASSAEVVAPNDGADLAFTSRMIAIGTGGTITVDMAGTGTNIQITVIDGQILPIRVTKVYSTGTTASGIVSLY